MNISKFNSLLLLIALLLVLPAMAVADTAVIVNPANTNQVDEQFIQKAFLGSVGRWPSRANIVLVELPESSSETIHFYAKLLHKSPAVVRDIWAANYFTGKASPPKQGANDDEVKRLVAANKHAIGFIHSGSVDGTVKVIYSVK
jgi:ABC-type phosphate transport system substrate-binding protein